ncbi:UTP--glucose-1-phosphate uridylyltransferase GalU [Candidatus Woesearchaeota archaeon]|nr:UTP--glucose-1-phosphate uridylyltransferase GalU [Candidatus Woesearchaeota archaeon]HIH37599.1 UTP--glucose-1-phosphate uridylyltransferase GalU [Candidatus Woesearchaeota archaeon]HIH48719.1 UTP--glucose-1-phosphate uridylyltransferase GalU [Candidatus Woesearchaeota archaeon]HIJ03045.1 UTP--glucose-1-phosphate uridylyltransferase GalU [Candidatus Woesearchaeota archaeon]
MIKKAVIPAAGLGTRFLPVTKSQPKEMLPIVDKPTIQYVVEEAVASGITDILIITGKGKRSMEDHFDRNFELEFLLKKAGKTTSLAELQKISDLDVDIHFIRQKEQLGLGHAILQAKSHIGNEPFVVLLGDSLILSEKPCTKQLLEVYAKYKAPIIGLENVPKEKVSSYGIVAGESIAKDVYKLSDLIEKPSPSSAPSTLAIAARYVLPPEIFSILEKTAPGVGGEIQLTDALRELAKRQAVYGYCFAAKRYDIGNRLDYVKAILEIGCKRPDIGEKLRAFIKEYAKTL